MVIGRAHYIGIAWLASWMAVGPASASDSSTLTLVDTPASEASLTPHLSSSEHGVYLSWLERTEDGHALQVSRWDGERFGDVHTVHRSDHFFANWADFASVLPLDDGRLVAHWLEKAAGGTYEYDVWIATSDDEGRSWSEPARPHRDGTLSEHGFVSMVPLGGRGFAAVWLDGRKFEKGASDNEMTLRFTSMTGDRGFGEEALLDTRVCECCQTGMAHTSNGLFVAYRDRSAGEIRDISYVRQVDGRWTEPVTLHEDGWRLEGCPVNGPQVAAEGHRVAVAWFTAANETPSTWIAFSDDDGATFGTPVRFDDGNPVGRVDIEWLDGDVVVSWAERLEGREGEVRVKQVSPSGDLGAAVVIAKTGSGRASGFARITRFQGELFVAWTESYERSGPSRVRVGRLTEDARLVDEPAREFDAVTVDGTPLRSKELAGNVVLINFWGIWCTSCRDEIPQLVELDRQWRDAGLVVLGADYGDDPKALPAFIEANGMSYPVLFDDGLADDYEVIVYPTSIVIDRSGRVRYRVEGFTEQGFSKLSKVVERLLNES